MRFQKVAVANRGEIAVRILHALKELGIGSVLLHSSEDAHSMAARLADESLCIGPGEPQESYLNVSAITEGLKSCSAEAIHPGVGFLSESSQLAKACRDMGAVFIGPSEKHMDLFGSKIQALQCAKSLGIPVLPSCFCKDQNDSVLFEKAKELGFPLMIKAAGGGGGLGLQKVTDEKDFLTALHSVQRLSQTAFGSDEIFLEKYIEGGRHIEVQIFGDFTGKIHLLSDRDCSVQRRHQKIIETAPVQSLHPLVREQIIQSAIQLGQSVQYEQAGTVEFLVKDNDFYFLEMNTRLQVEHPVTEMILGVDLVQAQILNAMKQPPFTDTHFKPRGYAMECRIYSQDSSTGLPVSGVLGSMKWTLTPHSRLDLGYESFDRIPPFYDSLIGKLIVWGMNREVAIQKMKYILENSFVFGVPTNTGELIDILSDPLFISNTHDLQFLDNKVFSKVQLSQQDLQQVQKYLPQCEENPCSTKSDFNPWFHTW